MKLFVTGASGFIGAAFAAEALEAGHNLVLLTRELRPWRLTPLDGETEMVEGALGDEAIVAALERTRPDCVVHLAWAGVSGKDRNGPIQIQNIEGSCRLLLTAARAGVKHFVATGSQAEYGPKGGVGSPDAATDPTTLYGEGKLATYRLLARLAALEGVRFAWLRVFSTYGPKDHPYWMIPGLIRALLKGDRPALTPGKQKWDFLHVADAARAILAVCESTTAAGVYNLGSGVAPPLRDTVSLVRDLVNPDLPLGFGELPYPANQVMHLEADITRLIEELGWHPRIALADGMVDTVRWYRENQWIFAE